MFKQVRKKKSLELALSLPVMGWLGMFFLVPLVIILVITFRGADPYGGFTAEWSLESIRELSNPSYPVILWRTFWLSAATTIICLLLSIPTSYYLARVDRKWRTMLLILLIVPFWTNFLIRIFAWKALLHPEGIIKSILVSLNMMSDQSLLLYRPETVLLVLVYTHLPFALLPVYAAAEKFNFTLLEAAHDLGAGRIKALMKIFLPGISQGILAAVLVVFIPALGSYVVPDLVGGTGGEMLGNKIAQRTFIDRNLPHASALSALLLLAVLVPVMIGLLNRVHRENFRSGEAR